MSTVRLAFTGDIGFTRHYKDRVGEDLVDPALVEFLNDADAAVLNVEGAVALPTHAGMFVHTNHPDTVKQFNALNGKIWNLANNHTMDAEAGGMKETLRHAKEAGVKTIGAGMNLADAAKPLLLEGAGGIGLFGAVYQRPKKIYGAKPDAAGCLIDYDKETIQKTVNEIKASCRWCVMVIHSGSEFLDIPMQCYRDQFREYLGMGVDVIVAHHPHVPENYEFVDGKPVFYSLGNFIFDTDYQRLQPHTDTGVLLKLTFTESEVTFEAVGTKIDRTTGKISKAPLPDIFVPLTDEDYEALMPLAGLRFLEHEIRRARYVDPEKLKDFNAEDWVKKWTAEAEDGRLVMQDAMDERAKFVPGTLDENYAAIEKYLI